MDLYAFASIIVRYRAAAAAVLSVSLLTAVLLCFMLPRKYTSSFTILSPEGGGYSLLQTINQNFYDTGMKGWLIPKIISTDRFAEDVIRKNFMIWHGGKPVQISLAALTGESGREAVLQKAREFLRVDVDQMSGAIKVAVESRFPELSYKVADYILYKLEGYTDDTRRQLRSANSDYYESRIAEARSGLLLVEAELGEFMKANRGWLESDDPGTRLELQQAERRQEIYAGVYYELNKRREIDDLETISLVPPLEVLDRPEIPALKSSPRRKTILAAGALIGMVLSLVTAFCCDLFRRFNPT